MNFQARCQAQNMEKAKNETSTVINTILDKYNEMFSFLKGISSQTPTLEECKANHKKIDPDFDKEDPLSKCEDMGMPKQLHPQVVFPRMNRFKAISKIFSSLEWAATKMEVDLMNKTIAIWVMDLDWGTAEYVERLVSQQACDEITVPYYDGCGNVIFAVTYYNCHIAGHNFCCDYDKSDILVHKIYFCYDKAVKSVPEKN